MKKINSFLIVGVIALFSCKKSNDVVTPQEKSIDKYAIKQIFETQDLTAQRNMYNLLSSEEKSETWKQKYISKLSNSDLDDNQRNFILQLSEMIKPELFTPKAKSYLTSVNEPEIREKAITLFGVSGAFFLLSALTENNRISINVADGPPNCSCSKTSDYCTYASICHTSACTITSSGCGTWWSYSCDGKCVANIWG